MVSGLDMLIAEKDIKEVTVTHYKKVLEKRPIKSGLENYQCEREELCALRVKEARKVITPNWDIEDVKFVIKHLKKN